MSSSTTLKFRSGILTLLLLVSVFLPIFAQAQAAQVTASRAELSKKLESLLAELARLQALFTVTNVTAVPYPSVIFNLPYESTYQVQEGKLIAFPGRGAVRQIDQQLFDLFVKTLGKDVVQESVSEWRVFHDMRGDYGAFTEQVPGTSKWVVSVNREDFIFEDSEIRDFYSNLFIHEYAHMLITSYRDLETTFRVNFWTGADRAHEERVRLTPKSEQFDLALYYYGDNESRFVSDYATISVEEDLAETFLAFVIEDMPRGNTVRDRKILVFYEVADFVELRKTLRDNLQAK